VRHHQRGGFIAEIVVAWFLFSKKVTAFAWFLFNTAFAWFLFSKKVTAFVSEYLVAWFYSVTELRRKITSVAVL